MAGSLIVQFILTFNWNEATTTQLQSQRARIYRKLMSTSSALNGQNEIIIANGHRHCISFVRNGFSFCEVQPLRLPVVLLRTNVHFTSSPSHLRSEGRPTHAFRFCRGLRRESIRVNQRWPSTPSLSTTRGHHSLSDIEPSRLASKEASQ